MNDEELIRRLLARPEDRFAIPDGAWRGKTVLITGAAGFIGSELCRSLAPLSPAHVIALANNEERLTGIMRQMPRAQQVTPELADIRDERRMREIFAGCRPDIVFHSAAYKHVSLLEHFPFEAIENNALATARLAQLAEQYRTVQFVFISTDKAVNPISIMGASKRFCEILLARREPLGTEFRSLRCGNVLGSSGSVLPIWLEQIANGGPVTLTDDSAERSFITMREAAEALIATACLATPCGLFIYAPCPPSRIGELAQAVLAAFRKSNAIQVCKTGMRPGERVQERYYSAEELLSPTSLPHISNVQNLFESQPDLHEILSDLQRCCETRDLTKLLGVIRTAIPEYQPSAAIQSSAGGVHAQRCAGGH
ncbi:MAG: polysaccharide biosynthesis protein [Acidobacteriaceae bacterium]|nr:polysaccharide biosynthesis protein [Acidobacteriaceae bacterium]